MERLKEYRIEQQEYMRQFESGKESTYAHPTVSPITFGDSSLNDSSNRFNRSVDGDTLDSNVEETVARQKLSRKERKKLKLQILKDWQNRE